LKGAKIDCLSFVYVPATSAAHNRPLFLLQPFTVLMKKTRAVKQSIFLDVYAFVIFSITKGLVFLVKQVPGRGPEQRESDKTVLYWLIVILIN
jgi:hypothetical protein